MNENIQNSWPIIVETVPSLLATTENCWKDEATITKDQARKSPQSLIQANQEYHHVILYTYSDCGPD